MNWDQKLVVLRGILGADVRVHDFFPTGRDSRSPYRYAHAEIAGADERLNDLGAAAKLIGGHMVVWTHFGDGLRADISVSRPLEEDEMDSEGSFLVKEVL